MPHKKGETKLNNCSLRGCETQRKITLDYQSRHNPLFPRHSPPRFRLSFQSNQKFARSCDIRREQTNAIISSTVSSTLAGTVIFGSERTGRPPILRHAGQREIEFPVKTGNTACTARSIEASRAVSAVHRRAADIWGIDINR